MAQIDPIRFGDVTLMLGDGEASEEFTAPCGVTELTWTTSTQTQDEDLPDCEDPDKPGYNAPRVISTGDQVQIQGFVDGDAHIAWMDFIRSGEAKNVRLVYDKGTNAGGGRRGYYQGPAVATNREEGYQRRQSGRISVSLAFQAAPAWTPNNT